VYFYHILFIAINICGIDCQKKVLSVCNQVIAFFITGLNDRGVNGSDALFILFIIYFYWIPSKVDNDLK
jgi:hypothetical protein